MLGMRVSSPESTGGRVPKIQSCLVPARCGRGGVPSRTVRANGGRSVPTMQCGSSSVGRARAFQARGRGFDSRLPLVVPCAHVAQAAEHFLGKEEVTGSNPVVGSGEGGACGI